MVRRRRRPADLAERRARRRSQPAPTLEAETNTGVAPWTPTLTFDVTARFVEGSYPLRLTSSTGGASYVPLIVRNDDSRADLVVQHQTTTWQAYNRWGGYSLYLGAHGTFQTRSRIVSFDRPYDARGAGGMLRALPFIALSSSVTAWTSRTGPTTTCTPGPGCCGTTVLSSR